MVKDVSEIGCVYIDWIKENKQYLCTQKLYSHWFMTNDQYHWNFPYSLLKGLMLKMSVSHWKQCIGLKNNQKYGTGFKWSVETSLWDGYHYLRNRKLLPSQLLIEHSYAVHYFSVISNVSNSGKTFVGLPATVDMSLLGVHRGYTNGNNSYTGRQHTSIVSFYSATC